MKLFLVVRRDLSPGARAAQLCHAMTEFQVKYPETYMDWYRCSNTLVLLETEDEISLLQLAEQVGMMGVPCSLFREPDLGDAATAIAIGPTGRRFVRRLPLALAAP